KALNFPVNVMVRRGLPPLEELGRLGVARLSFGPTASYAAMGLLKRAAREVLENGTYESLIEGAITFDELNSLAVRRARFRWGHGPSAGASAPRQVEVWHWILSSTSAERLRSVLFSPERWL